MLKMKHKLTAIIFAVLTLFGLTTSVSPPSNFKNTEIIEPIKTNRIKRAAPTSKEGIHDFYHELANEVEAKVASGFLDNFHLKYHKSEYYQIQYFEFRDINKFF